MLNFLKRIFAGQQSNPYEGPSLGTTNRATKPATDPATDHSSSNHAPVQPAGTSARHPSHPEQQIADAIASKQLILAIKLLRQHSGVGLAESKRAIERGTWRELLP